MPMPPPKSAGAALKKLALERVQSWAKEYGSVYKKLALGYNYLKQVRKVDFNDLNARSELQRRVAEEKRRKEENVWRERIKMVRVEMDEARSEIEECVTQMDACFCLLRPNDFEFGEDNARTLANSSSVEENAGCGEADARAHGLTNTAQTIEVTVLPPSEAERLQETSDNEAVIENLRGLYAVLVKKLIPQSKKWTITMMKAGKEVVGDDLLKKSIDLKNMLEECEKKAVDLKVNLEPKRKIEALDDSDSDSDFVEVTSKDDYEAEVHADDTLLGIPFYPQATASSNIEISEPKPGTSGLQEKMSSSWKLEISAEAADPTTFAATLAKLKKSPPEKVSPGKRQSSISSDIPRVPFDVDLMYWGERPKPREVAVDAERLRFWGGSGREEETIIVPGSDSSERVIEFTGKFQPVKWSCRAPLSNGKLCPRMDREKCPFHGKIMARDIMGQLSNPEDRLAKEKRAEEEKQQNPDWQDPNLLKELKAATGVDLKMPIKKGKGKGKSTRSKKRYPGLSDIRESENTVRKRLEKKVFNRGSLKRIAHTMNKIDARRHKDKFADQFNYIFSS